MMHCVRIRTGRFVCSVLILEGLQAGRFVAVGSHVLDYGRRGT